MQEKFHKSYDHDEDLKRFEIFKKKLADFEAHNEKFKKGEVTYSVGINQFTDLSDEEFRKMNQGIQLPEEYRHQNTKTYF